MDVWRDVGLVGFVDVGNVFAKVTDFGLGHLRAGSGFGIRYKSPVGPLRVDLGFKLGSLLTFASTKRVADGRCTSASGRHSDADPTSASRCGPADRRRPGGAVRRHRAPCEVIDRVLAIVSGSVITLSEARAAIALGLVEAGGAADPIGCGAQGADRARTGARRGRPIRRARPGRRGGDAARRTDSREVRRRGGYRQGARAGRTRRGRRAGTGARGSPRAAVPRAAVRSRPLAERGRGAGLLPRQSRTVHPGWTVCCRSTRSEARSSRALWRLAPAGDRRVDGPAAPARRRGRLVLPGKV